MKRRLAWVPASAALLVVVLAVSPASALEEADRLFMVGERALADRFFPVARRALERFVARYPGDPRLPKAVLLLGKARLALGDAQSALEAFERARTLVEAPADGLEARFWEAEALFRLKRFSEARAAYDTIVRTDAASPLAPDALYGFGWCELELKRPEAAVNAFNDFLTTWPEHALAPSATLQLARALVDAKRVNEALPLLTGFAARYPGSKQIAEAQYWLGWVKLTNGDRPGGLADLQAFVAANPNHDLAPAARQLITQTLARYGNRPQLMTAYQTLMTQTPPNADSLYEAATIAMRLSEPQDIDAAWRKLKSEFPDHPLTLRLALDLASAAFKQKKWKDAASFAQVAAQSDDDAVRAEAWSYVGEAELKLERFAQAAKAFEAVGAIADVEAGVRYRALAGLGLAREQQKDWKAALAAYEMVARSSPDSTLRSWAKERAAAVKGRLPAPAKPAEPRRSGNRS
jgi:TolA-binding protein